MSLPLPRLRPWFAAGVAGWFVAAAPVGRPADGSALFADNCASCHGPDGKAGTPAGRKVHAKDLTISRLSDAAIAKQICEGTKDSHGRVAMPPFQGQLSAEEIQALIPVVKAFRK